MYLSFSLYLYFTHSYTVSLPKSTHAYMHYTLYLPKTSPILLPLFIIEPMFMYLCLFFIYVSIPLYTSVMSVFTYSCTYTYFCLPLVLLHWRTLMQPAQMLELDIWSSNQALPTPQLCDLEQVIQPLGASLSPSVKRGLCNS